MFREDGVICLSALAVQSLDTAVVKAVEATLIVSRMIFSTFVTGRVWLVRFAPKYATRAVSREIPQSELIPRLDGNVCVSWLLVKRVSSAQTDGGRGEAHCLEKRIMMSPLRFPLFFPGPKRSRVLVTFFAFPSAKNLIFHQSVTCHNVTP